MRRLAGAERRDIRFTSTHETRLGAEGSPSGQLDSLRESRTLLSPGEQNHPQWRLRGWVVAEVEPHGNLMPTPAVRLRRPFRGTWGLLHALSCGFAGCGSTRLR
jgi:hypothetical protein